MTTSMRPGSEKSVEELRAESERTREALATTVGALRDRVGDTASELKTMVSPAHIKQEIKEYVRQERESLIETVQRNARENPLQAAAVGAAVAYPALMLLRALPKPLWLIGAGLLLTSKRGRDSLREVQARVDGTVRQASDKATEVAAAIQSGMESRLADARTAMTEARDAASEKMDSLTGRARAALHDARDAMSGTAELSRAAAERAEAGAETARNLKGRAADMATSSRSAISDFVNGNPLLVVGLGAAVGAFIAASIPPSHAENRLFGSGSQKLKDKAREAVAQGIETAGDAVAEVVGAASEAATREGLDASGMQNALKETAGSVRRVAERGLDTALGGRSSENDQLQQNQLPSSERTPT